MKLVFYSVVLNHHQSPVADEFYKILGEEYCFVELINLEDTKGGLDYSDRPYLLRAWESSSNREKAMDLACTAECCVFGGVDALPYQKERMKLGLLSFDMGERWLKRGYKSFFSPRLLRWLFAFYTGGWKNKPLYKLCMSAFAAEDHHKMGTFKGKAYKWGYFTSVSKDRTPIKKNDSGVLLLMWCSRYLKWKHPELPILLAEKLKQKGYRFHLNMYGVGEYEKRTKFLAETLKLSDVVTFHGNMPNDQVHEAMRKADVFLFTSDRYEGWGAVANESMSEGCVLIASDAIGSAPYLITEGENGLMFRSSNSSCSFDYPDEVALNSLCEKVERISKSLDDKSHMQQNAITTMHDLWSPKNAAESFLRLIEDLKLGNMTSILAGPCSKA